MGYLLAGDVVIGSVLGKARPSCAFERLVENSCYMFCDQDQEIPHGRVDFEEHVSGKGEMGCVHPVAGMRGGMFSSRRGLQAVVVRRVGCSSQSI